MNPPEPSPPLIVGIGASAGGLEAFRTFFRHMPADSGMAFVLVQHLDPDHDSMLVELLQRETDMPVAEADDGAAVEADHVFVIPPNASLTIDAGRLGIEEPAPPRAQRRPIDTFFTALAEDQGENAICIVLSGTGSDGTLGVRKIKEHGGYALAQAGADSHAMEGMPHSAAATGLVDEVLKIEAMPDKLAGYRSHLHAAAAHKDSDGTRTDAREHLDAICALLHERVGHDFSQYKDKTLTRRVQRRMQVLQVETMPDYLKRLQKEPGESDALFHELLIGVTQFFRDADAWEALRQQVVPGLFKDKGAGDAIRVWSPGCATGEEVYTIAMLLGEALRDRDVRPRIQIFGTDVDDNAVNFARTARYKSLPGVEPERLERWFVENGDAYTPVKSLREMCMFSPHDLVKDPPFSKLDLICCRNLMIYMKAELQDRVLRKFHYALRPDGWLFLGQAEGVSRHARLFATANKKHRLFQRRDAPTQSMHDFSLPGVAPSTDARRPAPRPTRRSEDDRLDRYARQAMQKYSPAYVVIDRHHEILRFSGGEAGPYLEPSAGAASFNLIGITRKALRPAVRAAVQKAFTSGRAAIHDKIALRVDGEARAITVIAEPLDADDSLCVVAFQDAGPAESNKRDDQDAQPGVAELEQELHTTRVQLNATINELEATNEEMKSANEEYQSVNEELQSSNEELETSKEEMQSINEELQTLNAELTSKNSDLNRANGDLQNLLESTEIATLFLDNDLRIKSFTPRMRELFHLRDGDRGRPVTEIVSRLDYADIKRDVKEVLRNLGMAEREVRVEHAEATYIMRIRPYRTVDNVIDGVVITFIDITDRRRHEAERARLAAIVESSQDAIIGHTLDGTITSWNGAAERIFGYSADEAVGQPIAMLLTADQSDLLPEMIERLKRGESFSTQADVVRKRQSGRRIDLSMTVSPVTDREGVMVAASTVARDISERRESEDHRDLLLHELNHRAKNMLANVQSIALQTFNSAPTPEAFKDAFNSRLTALSHTHDLLMQSNWRGAALDELVARELAPYHNDRQRQWTVKGKAIKLNAKAALALGLGLHELATNAAKYGALSKEAGYIEVKWQTRGGRREGEPAALHLTWVEHDGPAVEKPERRGFGSRLIEQGLEYELDAEVKLEFKPSGVRCTIDVPLDAATQDGSDMEIS
ncbi:MAG TPA: chemotaxis protein CheB [Gammaproteobacteria bacterium]|nr:chemotaxis protein CheB [Gammaproteobacteria bacterium]